jgi:multisubunit Na+/H+ antiporter MnhC subunit
MSELEVQSADASASGLNQWQRVANTFIAPSKTFDDIKRGNRSWWLPLILMALSGYILFGVISHSIGMQQALDNQMRMNPKTSERMAQMTPEQRARVNSFSLEFTQVIFLTAPVIGVAAAALVSMVLLATVNFGFGGRAKYAEVFAVSYYAWLPTIIKVILGVAVIYAGQLPETFNIKNYAPTSIGAFLDPTDTNKALYALATSVDLVTIWTLVLMGMGIATVAGVKRNQGYMVVFGWWVVLLLFQAGVATAFS